MRRPGNAPMSRWPVRVLIAALVGLFALGCGQDEADDGSADLARGEQVFENNCVACHGELGTGTANGPPLVHEIYEPGHHSDESFRRAIEEGVPAHHWTYGDMPAIPGLSDSEIRDVTAYVRELQRDAGIID